MTALRFLVAALLALAVLYASWFTSKDDVMAAVVFAAPPAMLAVGALRWPRVVGFWSGVMALAWFSHGVMLAWAEPTERGYALAAVGLSLAVIFAANAPALQARFRRGQEPER